MKTTTLTLLIIGFAMCANAQTLVSGINGKSDAAKEQLRGQVASTIISGFTVERIDGKLKKGRAIHKAASQYDERGNLLEFVSSAGEDTVQEQFVHFKAVRNTYTYDKSGVLVGNNRYDGNGVLQDSTFYKVDEHGNRIDWYTYKGDGTLDWNYNRKYDNTGNILETSEYHLGKLVKLHTYKYDSKGNSTEEQYFDGEGKLTLKENFKYDGKRNMIEVTDRGEGGVFLTRYTYKYDAKGNQIEERAYDQENSDKCLKVVTKFDKDGNAIAATQYGKNGKIAYECKLDKQGNHTFDATYDKNGKVIEKVSQTYKYDDKGNEIESVRLTANGKPAFKNKYIYTYDNEKNWFLKICYENDKPIRITERAIKYYDPALTQR